SVGSYFDVVAAGRRADDDGSAVGGGGCHCGARQSSIRVRPTVEDEHLARGRAIDGGREVAPAVPVAEEGDVAGFADGEPGRGPTRPGPQLDDVAGEGGLHVTAAPQPAARAVPSAWWARIADWERPGGARRSGGRRAGAERPRRRRRSGGTALWPSPARRQRPARGARPGRRRSTA